MIIRAIYPYDEFDPNGDYANDQRWTLLRLRLDRHQPRRPAVAGQEPQRRRQPHRLDQHEHRRRPAPRLQAFGDREGRVRPVHLPAHGQPRAPGDGPRPRQADEQRPVPRPRSHPERSPSIPVTHFKFRIDFYKNVDWRWVRRRGRAKGSFTAKIRVPNGTPTGMYQGAIVVSRHGQSTASCRSPSTVPAKVNQTVDGSLRGSLSFGGKKVADAQKNLTYDNGSIFGANDWSWRAESGDWRFFYFDVPKAVPDGTLFLSDTTWDDHGSVHRSRHADLRTVREQPTSSSRPGHGRRLAVHPRDRRREREHQRRRPASGRSRPRPAAPRRSSSGPASEGLHAVVQHGTGWNGDKFHVPFTTTVGTATVAPGRRVDHLRRRHRRVRRDVHLERRPAGPRRLRRSA